MSGIAKIFLGIALIGTIASGIFGYMINTEKMDYIEKYNTTSATLESTKNTLKKTEQDLTAAQAQVKDLEGKLTAATGKGESLESALKESKAKVADLEGKLSEANQKATAESAKLKEIEGALAGSTPQQLKDTIKKSQADVDRLTGEKKKLEDDLSAQKAEVARLLDLRKRAETGEMPPGINGKILTVNKSWNFVVLNVGDKDGVVENGILVVYRGKEFVGKVKVVSTDAHSAVADIIPEMSKMPVQVGDEVFN